MESGDSFDLGSLVFSPIDEGLPFAPSASSPPPPLLVPKHTNGDLPQSAAAVELQGWELPAFSSTPTDKELVLNHLAPAIYRIKRSKGRSTVVNTDLPVMKPWELPGMSLKEGRTETYYLTDYHDLCVTSRFSDKLKAPDGFWKKRGSGWAFAVKNGTCSVLNFIGRKLTFDLHFRGVGSKTNWTMNVYYLIDEDRFIENELVLCHVFEEDSPAYDPRPKCYAFHDEPHYGGTARNTCNGATNAPSNGSFAFGHGVYTGMHHCQDRRSDPKLTSYIADLDNLLFGDPDTSTDTDNCNPRRGIPPIADDGQSRKRKKNSSDVWHYFTKIFARDRNGKVLTFAACNHCFKVLTGDSSGGTTHLARHKCSCPCKLQPVAAGRYAQGDVNVLSS